MRLGGCAQSAAQLELALIWSSTALSRAGIGIMDTRAGAGACRSIGGNCERATCKCSATSAMGARVTGRQTRFEVVR